MTYVSEKDEDERTALEDGLARAAHAWLEERGYELEETTSSGTWVAVAPDGKRTWLKFAVEEAEIVEPEPGTVVEAHADGCVRRGTVTHRGPGFFVFAFTYKSGERSTGVVTSSDTWRPA